MISQRFDYKCLESQLLIIRLKIIRKNKSKCECLMHPKYFSCNLSTCINIVFITYEYV